MSILYFFESIRCPVLDGFFSLVTRLGEESIFMIVAMTVIWCVNKYEGYFILAVNLLGTAINQVTKIACRIVRPWVHDPNFTIVESAREAATGYSFPSGHSQNSVGVFGSLARWTKNKWIRIAAIAICVLVPVSRMYLGVHYPSDVLVGSLTAVLLVLVLYPIFKSAEKSPKTLYLVFGVLSLVMVAGVIYVTCFPFPTDTDPHNLASAVENLCKLLGSTVGAFAAVYIDSKYIRFDTKAPLIGQLLKIVLGFAFILAIQNGLKPVMNLLLGTTPLRHSVRYFLMVIFGGAIWPLTFKWFAKIGKKKS